MNRSNAKLKLCQVGHGHLSTHCPYNTTMIAHLIWVMAQHANAQTIHLAQEPDAPEDLSQGHP